MLPETTGVRVVCMLVDEITRHRERFFGSRCKREDTTQSMFLNEKIACREREIILRHQTGIFKPIPGMQVTSDLTTMTPVIFRGDQYKIIYFQPYGEMRRILKLIQHIGTEIRHMPAHAKWRKRTQNPAGIDLPTVIGIVQITVRGKIIARNHTTNHPLQKNVFDTVHDVRGTCVIV